VDGDRAVQKSRRFVTALSRKCQYALRALYFLSRKYGSGPILVNRISEYAHAPAGFLQAILLDLKNAGVLASCRGSHGGYQLRIPPDRVTVGSIVRLIDVLWLHFRASVKGRLIPARIATIRTPAKRGG
jgi:Rrf2 family protein